MRRRLSGARPGADTECLPGTSVCYLLQLVDPCCFYLLFGFVLLFVCIIIYLFILLLLCFYCIALYCIGWLDGWMDGWWDDCFIDLY